MKITGQAQARNPQEATPAYFPAQDLMVALLLSSTNG